MREHINARAECQPDTQASQEQTTPPGAGAPTTLVARYGAAILTGGHTSLPTYAWVYYARLGVSEAEFVYLQQLCSYWWSTRDPFPGDAAIAARMGKTVRCIQGYSRSLVAKGLLHIHAQFSAHGRQQSNAYDLRPFFAAVEGLARLDGLLSDATPGAGTGTGPLTPATPATAACPVRPSDAHGPTQGSAEQDPLCVGGTGGGPDTRRRDTAPRATEKGEGSHEGRAKNPSPQVDSIEVEPFDLDSIPLTPAETARTTLADDRQATADGSLDDQVLAHRIADFSSELGDDAPTSSLTRARSLGHIAGVPPTRFLQLLDEAAARTRVRQAHILKRQRDGLTPNGMPYLFAVLQDLLHPTPPRMTDGGLAPDRRRTGPPDRRRRRANGCGEPTTSYAAWSDSPALVPITEEHPVWRAALDELARVMTAENFNAWLATTRALGQDGALLRVAVPAAFNKTWLEQKLADKVLGALRRLDYQRLGCVGECITRVEYVVEAA